MRIQGQNSALIINQQSITLSRNARYPIEKTIPFRNITAVTLKPASMLSPGYILFSLIGGTEPRSGTFNAASNDNAVLFGRKQEPAFREAKQYIERVIITT